MASIVHDHFAAQGYLGPLRVLSTAECSALLRALAADGSPPAEWGKGLAPLSRACYDIGTHPAIMEVVTAILGDDVMLWGASVQERGADAVHPWHTDIEVAAAAGRAVNVWLGLENTRRESCLRMVPGSHRFGISVQQLRFLAGVAREEVSDAHIARWACERQPRSSVIQSALSDGEALLFDGALWHASHNRLSEPRCALLLQYATPDVAIHMPDLSRLDWPFCRVEHPRPACVMVRGNDTAGVNRVVAGPAAGDAERLTNRLACPELPLPRGDESGWSYSYVLKGSTANLERVSWHVSTLQPGCCPHEPHIHDEDELLVLLSGAAELTLPDAEDAEARRMRLAPGQFVYYPAGFKHTLRAVGEVPANYAILKWRNVPRWTQSLLRFGCYDAARYMDDAPGFRPQPVFEGATAGLRRLHCHVSTLAPGAGYEPHIDAHDVAIVVITGEIETLGQRVGPTALIFHPAGEAHGLRNPGAVAAGYVVFEFHGR